MILKKSLAPESKTNRAIIPNIPAITHIIILDESTELMGLPQFGQFFAVFDISFPHSGHFISAILFSFPPSVPLEGYYFAEFVVPVFFSGSSAATDEFSC